MSETKKQTVKKKKTKRYDELVRKGLKSSTGFAFSLLVNVIIVYLVVKLFSFSFNFTYSVFGSVAKDPAATTYKVVEIPADSSVLEIGEALEKAEIIDSKYVFFAKVKVKGCADKIVAGQYGLSAHMDLDDILTVICHINDNTDEDENK